MFKIRKDKMKENDIFKMNVKVIRVGLKGKGENKVAFFRYDYGVGAMYSRYYKRSGLVPAKGQMLSKYTKVLLKHVDDSKFTFLITDVRKLERIRELLKLGRYEIDFFKTNYSECVWNNIFKAIETA